MKPTTVEELIYYLQQFDKKMPVAYKIYSECELLNLNDIEVKKMRAPRADGWIHTYPRSEEDKIDYLLFPGN